MTTVFFAYSHQDEELRDELEKHLAVLKRDRVIDAWHDRRISPGDDWKNHIDRKLEDADIILLMVSADFLHSDYCYDVEAKRALQRHRTGEARVIPVILRSCDWKNSPLGELQALPTDGRPITKFPDRDEAFLNVVDGIRRLLPRKRRGNQTPAETQIQRLANREQAPPRSSNLRVKREFSDSDLDAFLEESFDYVASYFENSLRELEHRNPGLSSRFKRIDSATFGVAIYEKGRSVTQCEIKLQSGRDSYGKGITYSAGALSHGINEQLTAKHDGYALHLEALMGSAFHGHGREQRLTQEGAAELLWSRLIEPLQQ